MPVRLAPLALALLVTACAGEAAPDAAAQACEGALARLMPYAGSYDTDAVLNDPEVAAALGRLLGRERDHLLANIAVRGTADLVACDLVIAGNAEHGGGEEDGIVAIHVPSGRVAAAVHSGGRFDVYVEGGDYGMAPLSIKDWIAVVASEYRYRFDPPPNARTLGPQGR